MFWDVGTTTEIMSYAKGLISDLSPILLIIVGVGVGLFILWGIVSAIKR